MTVFALMVWNFQREDRNTSREELEKTELNQQNITGQEARKGNSNGEDRARKNRETHNAARCCRQKYQSGHWELNGWSSRKDAKAQVFR